jgi:hypothetical protein
MVAELRERSKNYGPSERPQYRPGQLMNATNVPPNSGGVQSAGHRAAAPKAEPARHGRGHHFGDLSKELS